MFDDNRLNKLLSLGRKLIPRRIFNFAQPIYHWGLVWAGAVLYGFPSRRMKVIGVTGTKGKSTTVYLISKIFDEVFKETNDGPAPVAAVGSLGFKIKDKEWPNNLKMTMPGRFKLQKFLKRSRNAGVKYVILEVTSEGIKQKRHLGISFDSAVLTGIHKEHIESHGSFEKYVEAKKELFYKTKGIHILNADDKLAGEFKKIKSDKKVYFKMADWESWGIKTKLEGDFNRYNLLAAAAVAESYGVDRDVIKTALEKIELIPGRMEALNFGQQFKIVIDYAHTPDSLKQVYKTLRGQLEGSGNLICILGAAGGGRDKWKRPEFGKIAGQYCDKIILTNEDPYDENPLSIIEDIESGFSQIPNNKSQITKHEKILDRKEAIHKAVTSAYKGDIVVITGKGSENSMAINGGRKISWSDKEEVRKVIKNG